jgi:capsular polysaccharide biosynthesis protein
LTAGDLYRALWRHKFLILLLTMVFVGAAWYVTSQQPQKYEASTLVRVEERGDTGNAALLAAQTLTQTYAKIIGSGALKADIKTLVAGCASGTPSGLSGILPVVPGRITARGSAPPAGSSTPTAVSPATSRAARVKAVHRRYVRACRSIGVTRQFPASPRKVSQVHLSGSPVQDLDLLTIAGRSKARRDAAIAANAAPWALRAFIRRAGSGNEKVVTVKAATMPDSPVSRQLPLKIAIAVMVGLIFNGALVLLLELFRDRLPEPDQLGQEVGVPVLATIPALRLYETDSLATARPASGSVSMRHFSDGDEEFRTAGPRVGPEA